MGCFLSLTGRELGLMVLEDEGFSGEIVSTALRIWFRLDIWFESMELVYV